MKVLGETALCGAGWQGFAVNPHLYSSVYTSSSGLATTTTHSEGPLLENEDQ